MVLLAISLSVVVAPQDAAAPATDREPVQVSSRLHVWNRLVVAQFLR